MSVLKVWDGTQWVTTGGGGGGSAVYVSPSAPPGTPKVGDEWFDTDEPSPLTLPINVSDGGTGGQTAAVARTNLAVPSIGNSTSTAGAPTTGTWNRGDLYLDAATVLWLCTTGGTPGTWTTYAGSNPTINARAARRTPTATWTFVNATSLTFFPNSSDRSALQIGFTKRAAGTRLLVSMAAHAYLQSGAAQQLYAGIWDGASTREVAMRHSLYAGPIGVDLIGHCELTGVNVGYQLMEPVFRSTTTATFLFDPNWEISYMIQEVP